LQFKIAQGFEDEVDEYSPNNGVIPSNDCYDECTNIMAQHLKSSKHKAFDQEKTMV